MSGLMRLPAATKHTSSVIILHGLGDSALGWYPVASQWKDQKKFKETEFIFPTAPEIPITLNGGMRMTGWYDIAGFEDKGGDDHDLAGIQRSTKTIHAVIAEEIAKGIKPDRIVLGGFSQGGAISIFAGATCPSRLAGIFSLSGYLLLQGKFQSLLPTENMNQETPVFMGYGTLDPLVRPDLVEKSAKVLKDWGRDVELKKYTGMPHSVCPEEMEDLEEFLKKRIPDQVDGATAATTQE